MIVSPLVLPIPVFSITLVSKRLLPWVWGMKKKRLGGTTQRWFIKSGWREIRWWLPKLSVFGVVRVGGRERGRIAIRWT